MDKLEIILQQATGMPWLGTFITALIILALTAFIAEIAARFLRRILHSEKSDLPSLSIFVNIARGVIWILGICALLSTCVGIDVTAAIAALGVGGLAISIGFKDTIANLIGGLQISLMGLIKPGDNIEVGSDSGIVKDTTWRHTTITNVNGEEIVIPNSIINTTALTHLPPANQVKLSFAVSTEGENLDGLSLQMKEAAEHAVGALTKIEGEPKIYFTEISDTGFRGVLIIRIADASKAAEVRSAVVRAVAPFTR
ncbi:MAG: mechanosensitive ion channel family protein [Eggerthellaceae bacterium]|jgi:small-conductance mechanosensitive channel